MIEYKLCDDKSKITAIGTLRQMFAMVKHHRSDGIYAITGDDDTDLVVEKKGGTCYPTGGTLKGKKLKPMSVQEAETLFGHA